MWRTLSLSLGLSLCLPLFHAPRLLADPSIQQRATEEIAPGIRVRGGGVAIQLDPYSCDPPCGAGSDCQEVCRMGSCDALSKADNPCRHCAWECVEKE